MRFAKIIFIFLAFLTLNSCGGRQSKTVTTDEIVSIPEGAVSFEYKKGLKRAILLRAVVNDTIKLNALFDTGSFGVSISDSFDIKNNSNKLFYSTDNALNLKIGNWSYIQEKTEYMDRNHFFFKFHGHDTALLGWFIFRNRIIKISFQHHYIMELPNTDNLEDFDCIKIRKIGNSFFVPVTVSVDGKSITEELLIDTGNNGCVNFNNNVILKYNIDTKESKDTESAILRGTISKIRLNGDTIKVGKNYITDQYVFFQASESQKYPESGLIGLEFFENYTMILDFKNEYLYLKPI